MKDNIDVSVGAHPDGTSKRVAVVEDRVSKRAWSGEGATDSAAATEAVRKFLGDRRSSEYVK